MNKIKIINYKQHKIYKYFNKDLLINKISNHSQNLYNMIINKKLKMNYHKKNKS